MDNPHIERVIRCRTERRGSGQGSTSPIRIIEQLFELDGTPISEADPAAFMMTPELAQSLLARIAHCRDASRASAENELIRFMGEHGIALPEMG